MSLLAAITWDDDANFTITFVHKFILSVCMYVCPVMGSNVLQIIYADCAAFSPHSGFVSLSLYVLFSHDKTVSTLQKYYFSCTSYHF